MPSSLYFSPPQLPLFNGSCIWAPPLGSGRSEKGEWGNADEAHYDGGVDRFREPRGFSRAAGRNAEALGHRLQAMHGDNGSVAKNSQHGGTGSWLSASRGGCSNRQSGVRGNRPSHARGGEARFRPSALRQFLAAVGGGSAVRRSGNKTNALSR